MEDKCRYKFIVSVYFDGDFINSYKFLCCDIIYGFNKALPYHCPNCGKEIEEIKDE